MDIASRGRGRTIGHPVAKLVRAPSPETRGKQDFTSLDALDSMRTKREHGLVPARYLARQSTEFAMAESAPLATNDHYEQACDQAIAMCGGNLRGAIKALIMANEYLENELQELEALVSGGLTRSGSPRAKGAA
jgi:hypothetical protein